MEPALRMKPALSITLLLSALAAMAPGCSLTREGANCSSTSECADAFGPGYVCDESGLCIQEAVEPSCQHQIPDDLLLNPEGYADYVLIGSLLRATGKEGARQDAAELAILDANRFLASSEETYPELAGLRFGMIQCDHDGDTDEVARLTSYLTNTLEVPIILGPASSSRTVSAFEEVNLDSAEPPEELRQTLFISPSATSVALTNLEEEQPGLLWRTAPTDDRQAGLMGAYAVEQGLPLAAFYEDTAYGRGLYAELKSVAGDLCDDCGVSFEADSTDVVSLARALASNKGQQVLEDSDLVLFMGAQETHIREMMKRLDDAEFAGKMVFFSDAAASTDLVTSVPAGTSDNVLGTRVSPPADTEALRFFTSSYEAHHDESPLIHSFTANSYDGAWLAVVATLRAALNDTSLDASGIAEGLRHITDSSWSTLDDEDCPLDLDPVYGECPEVTLDFGNLSVIVDAFQTRGALDVTGASGRLDYCASNEELERDLDAFEIWRLEETGDDSSPYNIVSADYSSPPGNGLPPCPE